MSVLWDTDKPVTDYCDGSIFSEAWVPGWIEPDITCTDVAAITMWNNSC
jgi:hypothetical protein